MNHDGDTPIHASQIPLGYELLATFGEDESEARALQASRCDKSITILVIYDDGSFSVWLCRKTFWPLD